MLLMVAPAGIPEAAKIEVAPPALLSGMATLTTPEENEAFDYEMRHFLMEHIFIESIREQTETKVVTLTSNLQK